MAFDLNSAVSSVFGSTDTTTPESESTEVSTEEATEETTEETESVDSSQTTTEEATKIVPVESDELEYSFTDESGKKQTAKVSLKDREALKKELSLAKGARKWQSERDNALNRIKEIEPDYKDVKESWSVLEKAWDEQGVPGLINLLTGKDTGYNEFIAQEVAKAQKRAVASPQEIEHLDLLDKLKEESRLRERAMKEINSRDEKAKLAQESAELEQTRSLVAPAFEAVRFAGKLGNAKAEQRMDDAIWQQSLKELEEIATTKELTTEIVTEVFKQNAEIYSDIITKKAEDKANNIVATKKADSQNKVAAAVRTNTTVNNKEADFRDKVSKGNLRDAFAGFFS